MAKILSTVEGGMIFTNNKKLKNEIVMSEVMVKNQVTISIISWDIMQG